jgi:1-acyl-sn-glycerol-3-phosphate acyltransferase
MDTMPDRPSLLPPKPISEIQRYELTHLPRLTLWRRLVRWVASRLARWVLKVAARVQVEGLENFPRHGPYLIVTNHLGDADAVLGMAFFPHIPDALAKIELYEELGLLGKLIHLFGVIWVRRGQPDRRALHAALESLRLGRVVAIAPEGRYTLSDGLEPGSGGAAFLALKSGVPVVPVVFIGSENEHVYGHLRRFRRVPLRLRVGKPFHLESKGERMTQAVERATEHIMLTLATLLPEEKRGVYREKLR